MATRLHADFSGFLRGVQHAEDLILSAYGSNGGNVMLCGAQERRVFDDGFKALEIYLPSDPVEREAVAYLHGAAAAAHGLAGDGTSTTVLLTAAMIRAGRMLRNKGFSAREVVSELRSICGFVVSYLRANAAPPEERDVVSAVTLAMHGDENAGRKIGSFLHKAGENAVMVPQHVVGGQGLDVVMKDGLVWGAGVSAAAMLGRDTKREMEDVFVIMSAEPMADMQAADWGAIRHAVAAAGAGSILLICPDVSGTVLSTFTRESASGGKWTSVGVPDKMNAWEFLNDLASVIGGKVIDASKGNIAGNRESRTGFDVSWFGRIGKFTATERSSCIEIDAQIGPRLESLRSALEARLEDSDVSNNEFAKNAVKARLQFLSGSYGQVLIPYYSQSQYSAVWESVQDGVLAGRAALKGVLPGCSKSLYAAWLNSLERMSEGEYNETIYDALWAAMCHTWYVQVHRDGPEMPDGNLDDYWNTVDTRTREVVDAREAGIVDGLLVVETAVNVAMEVAIPVIETNMLIVFEPDGPVSDEGAN